MEEVLFHMKSKIHRSLRLGANTESYFHVIPTDIIGMTLNYFDVTDQARLYLSHHSPSFELETIWKGYWLTRISYDPIMPLVHSIDLLFIACEFGHLELVKNLLDKRF